MMCVVIDSLSCLAAWAQIRARPVSNEHKHNLGEHNTR